MAVNHPAGHLAEFWVQRIGHFWSYSPDTWSGIPSEIADYLAEVISNDDKPSEVVEIIFCRHLAFFYQADKEWCRQYLLPMLNWDNVARAQKVWSGYLSHGGWTNKLLSDGFLDMLVSTAGHRNQLACQDRSHR
jgi:hypothetical protein